MRKRPWIPVLAALMTLPLAGIPKGSAPMPFYLTDFPAYHVYWTAALCIACLAAMKILSESLKAGSNHLRWLFSLSSISLLSLSCNYLNELCWRNPLYDDATRLGSCICTAIIIAVLPWTVESYPGWRTKGGKWAFVIAAGAIGSHYVASAIVFFSRGWAPGAHYFDGHRILPALSLDALLLAAISYYCAIIVMRGEAEVADRSERRALLRLCVIATVGGILGAVVDNLRWLVPALWAPYPQDDYFILPASSIANSLAFVSYAKAHSTAHGIVQAPLGPEGEPVLKPIPRDSVLLGLTAREKEVARLLGQGLTYKEICASLGIRMGTMQTHVSRVYEKLGVDRKEKLMKLIAR